MSSLIGLDQPRKHELRNIIFKKDTIEYYLRAVTRACRDSYSHTVARELVPLAELLQDNLDILEDELNYKDNLLPLVVDWFSTKFFSWFEAPNCEKCSTNLKHQNTSTNQEGKRVEHFTCDNETCDFKFDFIRHCDPAILLNTRTGRCGEWAMCFLVILRSLDYDTRIVYDITDHVWNEVWSEGKRRWVHVDVCESVIDAPLLYEVGWSKKLEYCIAIAQYEITDVTRRYTINYESTKLLRTACDDSWLKNSLNTMTRDLLKLAPSDETRLLVSSRRNIDIAMLSSALFASRRIPDQSELAGRKTGSVQWRIARGEYTPSSEKRVVIQVEPSQQLREGGPLFGLYYKSVGNTYKSTSQQYDSTKDWSVLTYECHNLDFKYERDWRMSYVARYETCPPDKSGSVRWRYDLSKLKEWKSLKLYFTFKNYPNTSVHILLKSYSFERGDDLLDLSELSPNTVIELARKDLNKDTGIIDLVLTLEGGDSLDPVAWQKPQLFRQSRDYDRQKYAMSVEFF